MKTSRLNTTFWALMILGKLNLMTGNIWWATSFFIMGAIVLLLDLMYQFME